MDISSLIVRDPGICAGEPVFQGTRVPLRTILASLADGDTEEDILESYPTLTRAHLRAAVDDRPDCPMRVIELKAEIMKLFSR